MNKEKIKKLAIVLLPLNFIFIFFEFSRLGHSYAYGWRGVAIVGGIGIVAGLVLALAIKLNKPN